VCRCPRARFLRERPPGLPQQERQGRQKSAQPDEACADLHDLVLGDEVRRQSQEDPFELAGTLGRVVRPACQGRNLLKGALVDPTAEARRAAAPARTTEAASPERASAGFPSEELLGAFSPEGARPVGSKDGGR